MKKMLSLIALTAISMPAMAADKPAFYGSLGGGSFQLKSDGFDKSGPFATIMGGYNFNEHVAIEAAYSRLSNVTDFVSLAEPDEGMKVKVGGNAWDLSTKLSLPVGDRFTPYGRLGWSYLDLNARTRVLDEAIRVNDYDDAFTWAVGTGVKLNKRTTVNGEYARVMVNNGDFDRMSLNLSYRFGAH